MTTYEADLILKDREESFLLADGLEQAFLGIGYQFNTPIAVYSKNKALQCLIAMGMDEESAVEYFDHNIAGAYVGEQTPIFLENAS